MTQKQLAIKACKCLVQKQIESGSDGFSCATDADYCTDISWTDVLCALTELEQSERKTGEWIIRDNPGTGWYRVTCSECGEDVTSVVPTIGFMPNVQVLWDFCPDCGSYNGGESR